MLLRCREKACVKGICVTDTGITTNDGDDDDDDDDDNAHVRVIVSVQQPLLAQDPLH